MILFCDVMSTGSKNENSLARWIEYVFDHPVTDPAWHWAPDAPQWQEPPEQVAMHITEAFGQSGRLLAPFSDEQLDQGFWFLVSNSCMCSLVEPRVPIP